MTIIGQATLGLGSLLGQGLVVALHDWYRKAELTSDRAGLLCVQELEPCMRAFMKMAGWGESALRRDGPCRNFCSKFAPTKMPTSYS